VKELLFVVLIVDGMYFGKHALMQDAGNQKAPGFLTVKQYVFAVFHTT